MPAAIVGAIPGLVVGTAAFAAAEFVVGLVLTFAVSADIPGVFGD